MKSLSAPRSSDDLSTHLHRQAIGYLGLLLPVLVWLLAGVRPTEGLERPWDPLRSISAYYHTGAVAAFVGILAVLAVFLLTYRGYGNAHWLQDRVAATIAGVAAALVAVFPTHAPEGVAPSRWTEQTQVIHHVATVILFGSFIYFSLFLFTKSASPPSGDKRARNGIYVVCGIAMIACVVWAAIAGRDHRSIFWPEALALEFFAVSWLTKGRAEWTAESVVRRTVHYGRHPDRLAADLASAVREKSGRSTTSPGSP